MYTLKEFKTTRAISKEKMAREIGVSTSFFEKWKMETLSRRGDSWKK